MEGMLSLILFTLLLQGSIGMTILQVFFARRDTYTSKKWSAIAFSLAVIGTLISLMHLSAPFSSFYTITNIGTSWLSREIVSVSFFNLFLLLFLIKSKPLFLYLSAASGALCLYAMSGVYNIPNIHFWSAFSPLFLFSITSLLLGSISLLTLDLCYFKTQGSIETLSKALQGMKPIFFILVLIARISLIPMQCMNTNSQVADETYNYLNILFDLLGIFMLYMLSTYLLNRKTEKISFFPFSLYGMLMLVFIWLGEFFGRVYFFTGYTWFGM